MKTELKDGNLLIALFMGYEVMGQSCSPKGVTTIKSISYRDSSGYYHESVTDFEYGLPYYRKWDYLMQVVQRISKNYDVHISSAGMWVTTISRKDVFDGEISSMGGLTPIQNTWTAVVRFIEWQNKQSEKYKTTIKP